MRVNPPIEIGRCVLRRGKDGHYHRDWIRQALVTVGLDKSCSPPKLITEQGVLVWSDDVRVNKQSDRWINYMLAKCTD